jgi:hypothetical protein
VPAPAKRDPNPKKLGLRLLFFSSLIFISSEKALESRFRHKRELRLQASGDPLNFVSNTGSKLLVWQRQIDENLKGVPQRFPIFVFQCWDSPIEINFKSFWSAPARKILRTDQLG